MDPRGPPGFYESRMDSASPLVRGRVTSLRPFNKLSFGAHVKERQEIKNTGV